jgi:peptide-methionine (S)-S-oxide reductase
MAKEQTAVFGGGCFWCMGHVEVVRVTFDPAEIGYRDLLEVFFAMHDPTTLDRQGNDAGEQYRSVIFYSDDEQKKIAENAIAELTAARAFPEPIVTAVEPAGEFYVAEDYHQNYYNENSRQPYCMFTISPKLAKLEKKFGEKLRA